MADETIPLKPYRAFTSLPQVGGDTTSHSVVLRQIREAVEQHERRRGDPLDSFVRIRELIDVGVLAQLDKVVVRADDTVFGGAVETEFVQDTIGNILVDTSEINFTYNDTTPSITATLIDGSINYSRLQNSDGVSVLGRAANTSGVMNEITAGANDRLLIRTADALSFGQLTAGMFPSLVVPDAALSANVALLDRTPQEFTGANQFSSAQTRFTGAFSAHGSGGGVEIGVSNPYGVGDMGFFVAYDRTANAYLPIAYEAEYIRFQPILGASPQEGVVISTTGMLQVTGAFGGGGMLPGPGLELGYSATFGGAFMQAYNRSTLSHIEIGIQSDGVAYYNSLGDPVFQLSGAGVLTLAGYGAGVLQTDTSGVVTAGSVAFAALAQGSARSVLGVTGNSTADHASIQGTANQVLRVNSAGTALAFGQVNLASTDAVTGTLPVGNGGTGATTLTSANLLVGAGTSAVTFLAPGSTGNVVRSTGSAWASAQLAYSDLSGTPTLVTAFTGLSDTPANYTGSANKVVAVNAGATALEFIDAPAGVSGANPTASVGLTAVNGSATTFLRSDGAPALSQSIAPTWTGLHIFNNDNTLFGLSTAQAMAGLTPRIQVFGTGAGSSSLGLFRGSATTGNPAVVLTKSRNTSPGSFTIVADGDVLGALTFAADDGTDYATPGAQILANVTGTPAADNIPTRLRFLTNGGASAATTRWTISPEGVFFAGNVTAPLGAGAIDGVQPFFQQATTGQSSASALFLRSNSGTGADQGGRVYLGRSKAGTTNPSTAVVNNDDLGMLHWVGPDTSAFVRGATIEAEAAETWSTSAHGARIRLLTGTIGSTSLAERARFASDEIEFNTALFDINATTVDMAGVTTLTLPSASIADAALSSNVPLLNASNTYTSTNTFEGAVALSRSINSVMLNLSATDAGTDAKTWGMRITTGGAFALLTRNDTGSAGSTAILCSRSGTTVSSVAVAATTITLNGVDVTDFARLSQSNNFLSALQQITATDARFEVTGSGINGRFHAGASDDTLIVGTTTADSMDIMTNGQLRFRTDASGNYNFRSGTVTTNNTSASEVGKTGTPSRNVTSSGNTAASDQGGCIRFTGGSGQTFTLDADVPTNCFVLLINQSGNSWTIAASNTLVFAGISGNRTLPNGCMAAAVSAGSGFWHISGQLT